MVRAELCDSLVFSTLLAFDFAFFPTRLAFDSASLRLFWLSTSTLLAFRHRLCLLPDIDYACFSTSTLRLCSCTNKDSAAVMKLFVIAAAVVNMSNYRIPMNAMFHNLLSKMSHCVFVKRGELSKI